MEGATFLGSPSGTGCVTIVVQLQRDLEGICRSTPQPSVSRLPQTSFGPRCSHLIRSRLFCQLPAQFRKKPRGLLQPREHVLRFTQPALIHDLELKSEKFNVASKPVVADAFSIITAIPKPCSTLRMAFESKAYS